MNESPFDIAVVGGGLAGLWAAITAAEAGASTVLLDAQPAPADEPGHHGRASLASRAAGGGVDLRYGSLVWGVFTGHRLGVHGPGQSADIVAKSIVLATGSIKVTEPPPGWSQPEIRLALMAECATGYSEPLGGWVPGRTRDLETTVPGLFVAGDAGGICPDAEIAAAEGRLAGMSAARSIGLGSAANHDAAANELERIRPGRLATIESVDAWYVQGSQNGIPLAESYSDESSEASGNRLDQTGDVICPCEGVRQSTVLEAIALGARSLNDVKRRTRAGMGICQGVQCGAPIRSMICAQTGIEPAQVPPMTARPPVQLMRLADLAGTS